MLEMTLYMKPTCHLCHDAALLLETLQSEFPFTIRQVDILQDKDAYDKYWEYIPVVTIPSLERQILAAPFGEATARKVLQQLVEDGILS